MTLLVRERIRVEQRRIYVTDASDTGSEFLNLMLGIIHKSRKNRKVRRWVTRLAARLKKNKYRMIDQLVAEGELKKEQRMILGLIPHTVYPAANTTLEDAIRARLMDVIGEKKDAEPVSLMLLSLLEATKLTRVLFDHRKDYRQARRKIRELTREFEVGTVLHTTIKEVCSVVITASTSAAVASARPGK